MLSRRMNDLQSIVEEPSDEPEEGVEEVWAGEIARRMADYRAGRIRTIPWEEVRAWLHRETT
ncbi:MAG: addiction module protein [Thermoanaerobaculia bacterium]